MPNNPQAFPASQALKELAGRRTKKYNYRHMNIYQIEEMAYLQGITDMAMAVIHNEKELAAREGKI